MKSLFRYDKARYGKCTNILPPRGVLFSFFLRNIQNSRLKVNCFFYKIGYKMLSILFGLEIPKGCSIGKGLYIGHAWGITINPKAILGENINIHKGVVIGQTNRGDRKGCPKIGNCVWIGINAAIVGDINIGNDVLIAPNSYINCDIPDHSIVFGNPCIIKHRDNATEGYINNRV